MSRQAIGVVGGGEWGRSLAAAAARTGSPTWLVSRRAGAEALPPGVSLAQGLADLSERAHVILLAVPSGVVREVARALGSHVDGRHLIVHGVRGLVSDLDEDLGGRRGLATISQIIRAETPARRVGALGGPALASDLLAGRPTVLVCASHYSEVTRALSEALVSPSLRLFALGDLVGLEWASALAGCLAIGVGYARGVGLGPGLLAAVISTAVDEMGRLAAAAGGEGKTVLGLGGYGDLLASIAQPERPEILVGEALARGEPLDKALLGVRQRIEAVELTGRVVEWAQSHRVHAPIFSAIANTVLSGRARPEILVRELMTAPLQSEPGSGVSESSPGDLRE